MNIPLDKAPFNKALELVKISDNSLLTKFQHLGLYENDIITRLDEDILIRPVKISTSSGMVILGAGMSSKVVVHLDDGRKIPAAELNKGDSGHIEGIIGGTNLAEALETLGLKNNEHITFIRHVPPMEYTVMVDSKIRVKLAEGIASKIWGVTDDGKHAQFSSSGKGKNFVVEKILGGKKSFESVSMHGGVKPGSVLVLEGVKPIDTLEMSYAYRFGNPVIITKTDGLRLIINKPMCQFIFVSSK